MESSSARANLAPQLTPRGRLLAAAQADSPHLAEEVGHALQQAFALGSGHGLLQLGSTHIGRSLPPAWAWWRDVAARYVTALCATPEGGEIAVALPSSDEFVALIADAPPMTGAEYLTPEALGALWQEIDAALREQLAAADVPLQAFLTSLHPAWNLVGRVHFNLAENRRDAEAPFAFLATYTTRLSAHGKAQHQPLSQALAEFSGGRSRSQLLSLLLPVQRAAAHSEWLREMVEVGDIYHPLRWSAAQAYRLLTDVPQLEAAGIVVRAPGAWRAGRPARPVVKASVGTRAPSLLGKDALLDFNMTVSLDGEGLSTAELDALLQGGDGLQLIRGRWVEVDKKSLSRMLERFKAIEQVAADGGLPLADAMRLLAGASLEDAAGDLDADWSQLVAGPWLAETLQGLRQPEGLAQINPGTELKATLRPYQQAGVRWLYLLTRLGLGACLADDMGLGKTIQVLALLLVLKRESAGAHQ
ncbi:MAG: SNF2 helicase-associated domain-containing protein, partial [Polaromonas sp.]